LQNQNDSRLAGLHAFSHPRYFYGQLLQVRHFTAEHEYFKGKNWLTNRLILGGGVACGLDVVASPDEPGSVLVTPGLALDRLGREIVVDCPTKPVRIPTLERPPKPEGPRDQYEPKPDQPPSERPDEPRREGVDARPDAPQSRPDRPYPERPPGRHADQCHDSDHWVSLSICFKSCESDPEPVMAGGCDAPGPCSFGTVRESYSIPPPRIGKLDALEIEGHLHRAFRCRPFGYGDLVEWITRNCDPCLNLKCDPCVPLANIRRPEPGGDIKEIDITIRPIVYTLDLLFDLILSQGTEPARGRAAK
jgi:hypothetical protein